MNMKKLAIIGGGNAASYFADACARLGVESHCFSLADGAGQTKDKVDFFYDINIFEKEKILDICKKRAINGVVATTELTIAVAAYLAEQLGLVGIPLPVAEVITDKYRNRLKIKGLQQLRSPEFAEVQSVDDIRHSDLQYPIILKPLNLGGKRGIMVVNDDAHLDEAFDFAIASVRQEPKVVIAEEFIEGGKEYSVESLSCQGVHTVIQITEKESSGAPHCVELAHHQPARLNLEMWSKVENAVSEGLSAIGLETGPCHTEIKIVGEEVYLIEFNARPGGDGIAWPLTFLSTGFPYMEAMVRVALGENLTVDVSKFERKYAGLYYVTRQNAYLKPIFDKCEQYDWCWRKFFVSEELPELKNNGLYNTNHFIYLSDEGNPVTEMINNENYN